MLCGSKKHITVSFCNRCFENIQKRADDSFCKAGETSSDNGKKPEEVEYFRCKSSTQKSQQSRTLNAEKNPGSVYSKQVKIKKDCLQEFARGTDHHHRLLR